MGALWGLLRKKEPPKTPIKGCIPRLGNIIRKHFRGIFGSLLPLILVPLILNKKDKSQTVKAMWVWMAWFFLLQPVAVPATGMIPVFMLPMGGCLDSDTTCYCYMNEGITMFLLGNMVLLLWNNSGLDRRLILWFLCSGDTSQYSGRRLVYKCCTAAFFLSMFCNKLIVANIMMQYITPIMTNMKSTTSTAVDANFDELRYILNSAIQTSCSIGGIAIVHSSYATLAFRAIFQSYYRLRFHAWVDCFNYLEYSLFALPLAIALTILNTIYHIILVGRKTGKAVSAPSRIKLRNSLMNHKKEVPSKVTTHEKLALLFSILALVVYFTRWNKYVGGWARVFDVYNGVPGVRDATVAAFFAIMLHCLPNGCRFIKIWSAKKKSLFGPLKPESGILWWRFVDKNIIYGYLFLLGGGVALNTAISETRLNASIAKGTIGKLLTSQARPVYLLIVCLVAVILSNVMSSVAAIMVFLPFILHIHDYGSFGTISKLSVKFANLEYVYLGSLAIGLSGSFSFMNPFLYTPAYFCHFTGKVPRKKMAIYGLGSAIICCLVLWVFISFEAPVLWSPTQVKQVAGRIIVDKDAITLAPGTAPGAEAGAPAAAAPPADP